MFKKQNILTSDFFLLQRAISSNDTDVLTSGRRFVQEYLWGSEFRSLDRNLKVETNGDMHVDYTMFDYNEVTEKFEVCEIVSQK